MLDSTLTTCFGPVFASSPGSCLHLTNSLQATSKYSEIELSKRVFKSQIVPVRVVHGPHIKQASISKWPKTHVGFAGFHLAIHGDSTFEVLNIREEITRVRSLVVST